MLNIILSLSWLLIIFGLIRLAVIINCHEDSGYIIHKRAEKQIRSVIVDHYYKMGRLEWVKRNKAILTHYHKNHPELTFKEFLDKGFNGKLYLP